MGKVWVFRYGRDVAKRGDKASWYVGWYDPEGRRKAESCGPGTRGKRLAERRARQIEAALLAGTYEAPARTTWLELRESYWRRAASEKAPGTQTQIRISLDHFGRICRPGRLDRIGSGVGASGRSWRCGGRTWTWMPAWRRCRPRPPRPGVRPGGR